MSQRLTAARQLHYATESTEGVDPGGTYPGTSVLAFTNLAMYPSQEFETRRVLGQPGFYPGKIGAQPAAGLSFTVQLRGGSQNSRVDPQIDPLLAVVLSPGQKDTGSTTVTGGNSLTFNVGST